MSSSSASSLFKTHTKNLKKIPQGSNHIQILEDQQKLDAVQTYVLLGSLSLVSSAVGVPLLTLRSWKTQSWWKDIEDEVRKTETLVLESGLKSRVNKALKVVEDRLENGDYLYDAKEGKMVRKPVPLKDAHKVVVDFINIQHKLVSSEDHKEEQKNIKDHLASLAKSFEQFAIQIKQKPVVEVTDVIFAQPQKIDSTPQK